MEGGLTQYLSNSAMCCSCTAPRSLWHLTHLDMALAIAVDAFMIQYPHAHISFAVIPLPWCCILWWECLIMRLVTWLVLGNKAGCLELYGRLDNFRRWPTLRMPSESTKAWSLLRELEGELSDNLSSCTDFKITTSASLNSWTDTGLSCCPPWSSKFVFGLSSPWSTLDFNFFT